MKNVHDFDKKNYPLSSHIDLNKYIGNESWSTDQIIKRIQELGKVAFDRYDDISAPTNVTSTSLTLIAGPGASVGSVDGSAPSKIVGRPLTH